MLALAALMLLAGPLVAHHHHGNVLCTVVEHCAADDTDNDEHTSHHDDGTPCIEKQGAIVSKSATGHAGVTVKWLPHFAAATSATTVPQPTVSRVLHSHHHIVLSATGAHVSAAALRGPPCAHA